jgi:hypothetical protein
MPASLKINMNGWMYSYADAGVAHAKLLLISCLEQEYPLGKKISFHQCILCIVSYSLQYLKTKSK